MVADGRVAVLATVIVWYLVQEVLGIFMRPLPGISGRLTCSKDF